MNNNLTIKRPLTPLMLEVLMDCHERELMSLEPPDASTMSSARGLVSRGMFGTKPYITKTGKKIIVVYITAAGRKYLSEL